MYHIHDDRDVLSDAVHPMKIHALPARLVSLAGVDDKLHVHQSSVEPDIVRPHKVLLCMAGSRTWSLPSGWHASRS